MKHFPIEEKIKWAKIYSETKDHYLIETNFINSNRNRYNINNNQDWVKVTQTLKRWSKKYSEDGMATKKKRRKSDLNQTYKRVGDLSKLNNNDLGVYIQILEELAEDKGVSKTEILEKMKKYKAKIGNKTEVSKVTGINRQRIYEKHKQEKRVMHFSESDVETVVSNHDNVKRVYGYLRLYHHLILHGINYLTVWKVRKIYEALGLKARKTISMSQNPKENKTRHNAAPNIINRNFSASRPNEKWFIDSSFIKIKGNKHLYLCAIIDSFSQKIVGYDLGTHIDRHLAIRVLNKAIAEHGAPVYLHSDNGTQFLANSFLAILKKHNIIQSNSRPGHSIDNRPIEYFFCLIKHEWLYHNHLTSYQVTLAEIRCYINWYNNERIQIKLKKLTPNLQHSLV